MSGLAWVIWHHGTSRSKDALEFPLPLLAVDALYWVVFGFCGSACLEILVKLVFLESTLSEPDFSLIRWFPRRDLPITFAAARFPKSSVSVTQTVFDKHPFCHGFKNAEDPCKRSISGLGPQT